MKNRPSPDFQYQAEINTSNPEEVLYWTKRWNVSSQQLVGAVKATQSNSVVLIEEYLANRKFRKRRPRFISQL
jgi:hypothetical protein